MTFYVMVWIEEEEKWYYFFNVSNHELDIKFPNGYVDYHVEVDNANGIILYDNFKSTNEGKKFSECYNISYWGEV